VEAAAVFLGGGVLGFHPWIPPKAYLQAGFENKR
jgi:hypothetical protein